MNSDIQDAAQQVDNHITCANQSWLLGAGASCEAGIPLMRHLTDRVLDRLHEKIDPDALDELVGQLDDDANIEDILTHLSDYVSLAERSQDSSASITEAPRSVDDLRALHNKILDEVASVVRWGFIPGRGDQEDQEGGPDNPIVQVTNHRAFIAALFRSTRAGLYDRRGRFNLFTTNYDMLLEDALALEEVPFWDGFEGGAVAFRTHQFGQDAPRPGFGANLVKLHGSID